MRDYSDIRESTYFVELAFFANIGAGPDYWTLLDKFCPPAQTSPFQKKKVRGCGDMCDPCDPRPIGGGSKCRHRIVTG